MMKQWSRFALSALIAVSLSTCMGSAIRSLAPSGDEHACCQPVEGATDQAATDCCLAAPSHSAPALIVPQVLSALLPVAAASLSDGVVASAFDATGPPGAESPGLRSLALSRAPPAV